MANDNWVNEKMAALDVSRDQVADVDGGLTRLQDLHRQATKRRGRVLVATLLASTSLMFAMALPAPRAVAQRCWDSFCSVQASFRAKECKIAPDFALRDVNGKLVKLSGLRGKVVLLDFWATDCGGCREEIPWFIELQREYRDRGLVVLGVSLDDSGWKVVKPFVEEKQMNYPVMLATDDVTNRYHIESMPTTLVIGKSGCIAATHVGLGKKEEFRAEIESLLRK